MSDLQQKLTELVLQLKGDALVSSNIDRSFGIDWAIKRIRETFADITIDDEGRALIMLQHGRPIEVSESERLDNEGA